MDLKITGLDGADDFGALYFDCSYDTNGPWFSIDTMTSAGNNLMYGLGVARNNNFAVKKNGYMVLYKWKLLG